MNIIVRTAGTLINAFVAVKVCEFMAPKVDKFIDEQTYKMKKRRTKRKNDEFLSKNADYLNKYEDEA